jgi:hypothetical protein
MLLLNYFIVNLSGVYALFFTIVASCENRYIFTKLFFVVHRDVSHFHSKPEAVLRNERNVMVSYKIELFRDGVAFRSQLHEDNLEIVETVKFRA